jgi:hypothetical protein
VVYDTTDCDVVPLTGAIAGNMGMNLGRRTHPDFRRSVMAVNRSDFNSSPVLPLLTTIDAISDATLQNHGIGQGTPVAGIRIKCGN